MKKGLVIVACWFSLMQVLWSALFIWRMVAGQEYHHQLITSQLMAVLAVLFWKWSWDATRR